MAPGGQYRTNPPLTVEAVRADFPYLERRINGQPIIYLDNAATTQKPRQVLDALVNFCTHHYANVHRATHRLSEEATELYEGARQRIAQFLDCGEQEIIFVRNATEGINLIAQALRRPGDILVPIAEHHSNLLPWRKARQVQFVAVDRQGRLDLDDLRKKLKPTVALLALSSVSNALGTANPIQEAIELARGHGVLTLVDASQSVAHQPTSMARWNCDFLVFSGHKIYGPSGIGVLAARSDSFPLLDQFLLGGGTVKEVTLEDHIPNDAPHAFEAGTPNMEGAVALGAALDFVERIGFEWIGAHEAQLTAAALAGLQSIPGVTIHGPTAMAAERHPIIALSLSGLDAYVVARILSNRANVMARAGFHCAHPLHDELDLRPTVRLSFGVYNTTQEIATALDILRTAKSFA